MSDVVWWWFIGIGTLSVPIGLFASLCARVLDLGEGKTWSCLLGLVMTVAHYGLGPWLLLRAFETGATADLALVAAWTAGTHAGLASLAYRFDKAKAAAARGGR